MKPHVHAEFIKAWADGEPIEVLIGDSWQDAGSINSVVGWYSNSKYRIKPQHDMVLFSIARPITEIGNIKRAMVSDAFPVAAGCNLKLVYDAQTVALKHAEVI